MMFFKSLCLFFILSSAAYATNHWQLSKKESGIQVYVLDSTTSAVDSFKGVVTIPASLSALVELLDDTKIYTRLLHDCKSAQVVKVVGTNQAYKYIVTNMPWPVKDRDMIVHSVLTQNLKTKQVVINMKAAPKLVALKANRVRIQNMTGRWILTPVGKGMTKVVYEMNVDPAGSLPKWLVNTLSVDIPYFTLNNLRELVQKTEYQSAKLSNIIN